MRPNPNRGSRRLQQQASPPEMIAELHVYLAPKEEWLETRRLAKNQIMDEALSVGFVRVSPDTRIHNLRGEIATQLASDVIPRSYVFLRSVGRHFTQVNPKQEHQLKAKNFVPPNAAEPEIYLLEVRDAGTASCFHQELRLSINRKMEVPILSSPPAAPSSKDSGVSAKQVSDVTFASNKQVPISDVADKVEEKSDIKGDYGREELSSKSSEYYSDKEAADELAVTFVILEERDAVPDRSASRERILTEISDVTRQRRDAERRRHVLVEKVTELERQLRVKREKSQHALREQLFTAKRSAVPLEEACACLRLQLDGAHRQLASNHETRGEPPMKIRDGPSKKANYRITATRLQHEIKDLQRKVNAVQLRLESETKLRSQAEKEVRQLRGQLSRTKLSVSGVRSQMLENLPQYLPDNH